MRQTAITCKWDKQNIKIEIECCEALAKIKRFQIKSRSKRNTIK